MARNEPSLAEQSQARRAWVWVRFGRTKPITFHHGAGLRSRERLGISELGRTKPTNFKERWVRWGTVFGRKEMIGAPSTAGAARTIRQNEAKDTGGGYVPGSAERSHQLHR